MDKRDQPDDSKTCVTKFMYILGVISWFVSWLVLKSTCYDFETSRENLETILKLKHILNAAMHKKKESWNFFMLNNFVPYRYAGDPLKTQRGKDVTLQIMCDLNYLFSR